MGYLHPVFKRSFMESVNGFLVPHLSQVENYEGPLLSNLAVSGVPVGVIPGPPPVGGEDSFSQPDCCFLNEPSPAFPSCRLGSHSIIYALAIHSAACCCGDTMGNRSDKMNRAVLLTIKQLSAVFALEYVEWAGVTLSIITALI